MPEPLIFRHDDTAKIKRFNRQKSSKSEGMIKRFVSRVTQLLR
jgi:hypothetical protein